MESALHLFCLGHFAYCVIPYWGGATPSQINSLGSIQDHNFTQGSTSFYHLACSLQHVLTHSLLEDRRTVVGHVLTDHMHSFMCTNHIDMIAHNPTFFTSWVALCEPLVCSYDISQSRAQQASITSLAASSVA